MAHTYCSLQLHCIFSTKERRPWIGPELQDRLWSYMGGIAREHQMKALVVGRMEDHAHILLSLPGTMTIAGAMQAIKGGSSQWLHEECGLRGFAWQQGYGAFSVGASQVEATTAYIAAQKDHHRKRDFQAEFLAFLKKNGVEYDARYVWG